VFHKQWHILSKKLDKYESNLSIRKEIAMGFLKKLSQLFAGSEESNVHREYVRCSRCGEKIAVRVNLSNELTPQLDESEGAYYVRKGVLGSGETRCFQMIEVDLYFDQEKRLISRYITGGEFITKEEFESQE
jgi:DNA-directed RNA polymerase subunit RPC12/RpoP